MTRSLRSSLPVLGLALLTLSPAVASAQGFALNRFDPSERGSDWFAVESLDLRGHMRPAVGVVGDWGYKPLVLYDANGDERAAIVEHQIFAHLGASLVMFDRVRFGVNLPLAAYQSGEAGTVQNSTFDSSNSTTVGDARIGADARIVGEYGDPVTLAGGLQVHLPTGSQDSFTGDGNVRVTPRVMAAGDIGMFTYAARLGFVYRANDDAIGGIPKGSELSFGAAAGVRLLEKKLTVGPELFGGTVVSDGDSILKDQRTTPVEVIAGAHYRINEDWKAGAGVGPGLSRGLGAPTLRVLATVEWAPDFAKKELPVDRDGDGILDTEDACPTIPGMRTDDPTTNGCPAKPVADRDGDTIPDAEDACPDQPGPRTSDPATNGCPPPPDRDKDGILDAEDACPDEPGVRTEDPKTNGCPPPKDRDGDTIVDPEDACPDVPGPANQDPKKHGCPLARIESGQIRITERVEFEYNSAKIRKESEEVLNAVLSILKDHPEITKISVEGHTDSKGADFYNKQLSQRRAASVSKWLSDKGIDKKRLAAKGWGEEKPIDSNDTDEGRQNNRRVEFHILELGGKPVEAGAPLKVEEKKSLPAPPPPKK